MRFTIVEIDIKVVFRESFRNVLLISWLVDLNKIPEHSYSSNFESLPYKRGLKILFGQTDNKLVQFSLNGEWSSSQGINKKRPYLIIGWLKQKIREHFYSSNFKSLTNKSGLKIWFGQFSQFSSLIIEFKKMYYLMIGLQNSRTLLIIQLWKFDK